jgi:hypothetical protein
MRIIEVIQQLLPAGTDAAYLIEPLTREALNRPGGPRASVPSYSLCPIWPPDLFAVVGTIIDRSGCYTEASPDRKNLGAHQLYLAQIKALATAWGVSMLDVPPDVQNLWTILVSECGTVPLTEITKEATTVRTLLQLFAIADEACAGMGWDSTAGAIGKEFSRYVLLNATDPTLLKDFPALPYWPNSLCGMVSPDHAVVLPKSITTNKGCTIRSLSHHLALLPCRTMLEPEWLVSSRRANDVDKDELRVLLVPFPYDIPKSSFKLSFPRTHMAGKAYHPAFFSLRARWLSVGKMGKLDGKTLAAKIVKPLIRRAKRAAGGTPPHGIVLPECALTPEVADELVAELAGSGIEFLITGVLDHKNATGLAYNKARTYVIVNRYRALVREQNKHHRWRVDEAQARSYGLTLDNDPDNSQWWEDIDVTSRKLPFYAMREDMSMVTLICEDLARMEPAMNAIRAVGPNLVVALLMDGPQLGHRWPARYASVLADEPGCAVLSLTCAATVDMSNKQFYADTQKTSSRTVARWTQAAKGGKSVDINLDPGHEGILLTLKSAPKHQTTLDNRGDNEQSRELSLDAHVSLKI